jgi:multiple sugar transport system permease protein
VGTCLALSAAVPLGFAAGYRSDRFANFLIRVLLLVYLLPPIFLVFPILGLAIDLGVRGNTAIVGVLAAAISLPFCAWILKMQFALVPAQLFEAAELDGLGVGQRLLHVIAPSVARGVVAAGAFALIVAWGEYVFSIALLPRATQYTVATGIPHFLQGDIWAWDLLLPAITIAAVPPIVGGLAATTLLVRLLRITPSNASRHASNY